MANVIMIIPRFYNPGSFAYFGLDFWMAVLTIGSYFLALLLPLSLLVYGFSIERLGEDVKEDGLSHDELLDSKLNEQDAGISPTECVSIRRWTMHTFFGNIPLAGVIFSGLWSRGKQAGPVRNWAGAQLLLSAAVLLLWLYLKFKGSSNFMTIFGVACLVIVILGAAAIQNVLKNKAGANDEVSDEPGVFDWLGRLLIACIPVIGWIYLAIWVNDKEEMNRRNWAAAQLIVTGLATLYGLAFWL